MKAEWQKLHDIVVEAGGLRIIGSERHESRRIDNQLRGRAGRQGDPGSSCFYLSMEDQLLRIFGGDRMRAIADKLRLEEGEAIESKMLTRMIESAQRKVEGRNYDIRKQLLEFDDVQNDQRHEIYGLRNQILESEDISSSSRTCAKASLRTSSAPMCRPRPLRSSGISTVFRRSLPASSAL